MRNLKIFSLVVSVLKNAFDAFDQEKKGCIGTTMVIKPEIISLENELNKRIFVDWHNLEHAGSST